MVPPFMKNYSIRNYEITKMELIIGKQRLVIVTILMERCI